LRVKTRLLLGYEMAKVHQDFQTLATVVSYAFGGKKKEEEVLKPANLQDAQRKLAGLFGR
jgi:hypothetical protein